MPSMRPRAGSSCWARAPGRMSPGARRRSARRTRTARPSRGARRGAPRGSNSRRASPGRSSSSPTRVPGSRRRTARRSSSPSIPPSRPDAAPGWVSPSSRARCTTWAASCGWTRRARAERPSKCSSLLCPPMVTFAPPLHNVERGPGGEDAALAAMKEGAYDYLPKPFRPDEVVLTLRKAEEREGLGRTIATLRAQLDSSPAARVLIAESPAMRQALEIVARVAEHKTTVLITGGRGTGKEVVAQAIHRASPRAGRPFVAVNCAAIPETLLESELFGYVKGAFTGAAGDRPGLF